MRHEALPQGLLGIPGEGFNGNTSALEVARTTELYNQPSELRRRFLGDSNPNTLHKVPFADGSEIRLHRATGPYAPHHFMMLIKGADFENKPEGQPIEAESLFQHDFAVQRTYWDLLLKGLAGYQEELGPEYRVFSGGNWHNRYSNYEERNSRTIAFHHDHIMAVKKSFFSEYVDGGLSQIEGLDQEKAVTNRLLPLALPRIQRALPESSPLKLLPRDVLPYGYSFVVPESTSMDEFTQLMREHHDAYTNVAITMSLRYRKTGANLLSQPSYSLLVELDELGDRHITVSPAFIGPIGVLERSGIQSKRHPLFPFLISPEVTEAAQNKVIKKIKSA